MTTYFILTGRLRIILLWYAATGDRTLVHIKAYLVSKPYVIYVCLLRLDGSTGLVEPEVVSSSLLISGDDIYAI